MAGGGVFDTTIQVLGKVLSLRSEKHRLISANIANAETPGYERLKMDFEEAMARAASGSKTRMAATHPRHVGYSGGSAITGVQPDIYRQPARNPVGDGNNVSLDREMIDLAENQIRYEATIRMLSKKFNMMKFVIQEKA